MVAHIDEVACNSFVLKYFQTVTMKLYDFAQINPLGCLCYILDMKKAIYTYILASEFL